MGLVFWESLDGIPHVAITPIAGLLVGISLPEQKSFPLEPSYTMGGNVSWYSHYRKQYEGSSKTKNIIVMWSCNPTPGHISGQNNWKRYMRPNAHSSTIHNSQDMETTKTPHNRWVDREDVLCRYSGMRLSHKKWNNAICSKMDRPGDRHTKWHC